jgi:hypothetical protein
MLAGRKLVLAARNPKQIFFSLIKKFTDPMVGEVYL